MKKFSSKQALLLSALSMVLCVSMLIGSTFAWFTDSATASVNTIQSGNLDIALEKQNADGTWSEVSENTALNFLRKTSEETLEEAEKILWEPGCTFELPMLRIRNNGNLALKYQVVISGATSGNTDGKDGLKLLEVLKFKAVVGGVESTAVNVKDGSAVAKGMLVPAEKADETNKSEQTIKISAHMDETANNDYRGLKIENIKINVLATQATYESDSNGNDYDKNAQYPTVIYMHATGTESLKNAITQSKTSEKPAYIGLAEGEYQVGSDDAIGTGATIAGAGKDKSTINADKVSVGSSDVTIKDVTIKGSGSEGTGGTLNINGANTTIENVDYIGDGNIAVAVSTGASNSGTVFKGTKITNAFRGIQFWSLSGGSVIDDCVLDVAGYTFNIDAAVSGSTLTIKNSTLNGWTSYTSGISLVSFENCKLGLNAYQYLRPYSETVIKDCEFTSAGYQLNAGGSDAYTITITNCTKNGTKITAENVQSLLLDIDDWNTNATLIVDGTTVTLN